MNIAMATSEREIRRCFPVMVQLRTKLVEDQFIRQVQQLQRQSYQLAYLEDSGKVRSLAGFRFMQRLSHANIMYVEDLVTADDQRSRGYGAQLFDWLVERAVAEGCTELRLDSGVQRFAAHRFYFARRMHISAYHFSLNLDERT